MKKLFFLILIFTGSYLMAQTSGDNCKLTLILADEKGAPIAQQKFKLLYEDGRQVGEWITDVDGKSVIQLKKNSTYGFETYVGKRLMKTGFMIENEDQVSFELQLAISSQAMSDSVKVVFHVTDEKGIVESEAKIKVLDGSTEVFSCTTDVDGFCSVMLLKTKDYKLLVEKFGKEFDLDLDIPDDPDLVEFTYNLKIKVVEKYTRTFVLENVYFDYNKWDIKSESVPALTDLYDMLKSDPQMKIEVGGHTDSDGNDASNMQLSQRRADAVRSWLVNKGISANRILTKGYGETTPIATNETDEGKAKNRRTEVKVISD